MFEPTCPMNAIIGSNSKNLFYNHNQMAKKTTKKEEAPKEEKEQKVEQVETAPEEVEAKEPKDDKKQKKEEAPKDNTDLVEKLKAEKAELKAKMQELEGQIKDEESPYVMGLEAPEAPKGDHKMKQNVKHNGLMYHKNKSYSLSKSDEKLFEEKGFI